MYCFCNRHKQRSLFWFLKLLICCTTFTIRLKNVSTLKVAKFWGYVLKFLCASVSCTICYCKVKFYTIVASFAFFHVNGLMAFDLRKGLQSVVKMGSLVLLPSSDEIDPFHIVVKSRIIASYYKSFCISIMLYRTFEIVHLKLLNRLL